MSVTIIVRRRPGGTLLRVGCPACRLTLMAREPDDIRAKTWDHLRRVHGWSHQPKWRMPR